MSLDFLTPAAALLAALVVVPLAALLLVRMRARRVRAELALAEPPLRSLLAATAGLCAVAALLALAATQPVLERTNAVRVRSDAQAFVVLDISRSMLARRGRGPMRIERAKAAATSLRAALPTIPVGIVSLTDRVLPHLFPSADRRAFESTLGRSVEIERPPPRSAFATGATNLQALVAVRTQRYFAPSARKRLLLVLTDGETQPVVSARFRSVFTAPPPIDVVFVRFWHEDERVYSNGVAEPQYRPDRSSGPVLEALAEAAAGSVHSEDELGAAARAARSAVGSGPVVARREYAGRIPLAPYIVLAALLPLALVLVRPER